MYNFIILIKYSLFFIYVTAAPYRGNRAGQAVQRRRQEVQEERKNHKTFARFLYALCREGTFVPKSKKNQDDDDEDDLVV